MAIHDRDYYREESGGLFEAWGRQGATVWLIVITAVVFFAQIMTGARNAHGAWDAALSPICELGEYDFRKILDGEVWRLVTAVFLHASLLHLICNMIVLYFAGTRLEAEYGAREFALFYVLAGTLANLGYLLVHVAVQPPNALAVGASGAVTAVLVLYAFHWPRQQILVYFVLPMPVWVAVVIYVVLDALGAFNLAFRAEKTAFAVHLFGALVGAVYYQLGVRITGLFPRRGERVERRERPRLRVVPAEPEELPEPVPAAVETPPRPAAADEHLEARVDAVLEKVSRFGQDSLSPEERQILFQASERYKRRRK